MLDTLAHLGLGPCHLVGASFGSGVAVEVALQRPELVRSLAICPPGGSLITETTPQLLAFVAAEREALARGDLDAAVAANIIAWVVGQNRALADVEPSLAASVGAMQRTAFEVTADWEHLEEVELDPPPTERLAEIRQRVLLVAGGRDLDTIGSPRTCSSAGFATSAEWTSPTRPTCLRWRSRRRCSGSSSTGPTRGMTRRADAWVRSPGAAGGPPVSLRSLREGCGGAATAPAAPARGPGTPRRAAPLR